MNIFNADTLEFDNILDESVKFYTALKVYPTKGNLVYEYNPFRNYRTSQKMWLYLHRYYTFSQLLDFLGYQTTLTENQLWSKLETSKTWEQFEIDCFFNGLDQIFSESEYPTLIESGQLIDFDTDQLSFNLNNPVSILPSYSYDNTVNLILNDGFNTPKLINSRFSATERNKYEIVDREGNNDTNIYDQGSQFEIDTSLYKVSNTISNISLQSVSEGGNLPVGSYHFYFKYVDSDGNLTDFIGETGLIQIFIGNSTTQIRGGFRDENSHKLITLKILDVDPQYQYIKLYYTRATGDILQNRVINAYEIIDNYNIVDYTNTVLTITGLENTSQIPIDNINLQYQIIQSAETQDFCQNRLFLGHIKDVKIPYQELSDISLRFLPFIKSEDYLANFDENYNGNYSQSYYNPVFTYNKTGYWNHEIYRFGIVYILQDNSLSPVFNVRGGDLVDSDPKWSKHSFIDSNGNRNYISKDINNIIIYNEQDNENVISMENSMGVIRLEVSSQSPVQQIYSINFKISKQILDYLQTNLNIKGFFFVRQKRIPTILCQGYGLASDSCSGTIILPTQTSEGTKYVTERFLNDNRILINDFESRLYTFQNSGSVRKNILICPEYNLSQPYYNNIFIGTSFLIKESDIQPGNLIRSDRHFYTTDPYYNENRQQQSIEIQGVEDNVKYIYVGSTKFTGRAGEAEEARKFEYAEIESKDSNNSKLIRGIYGPFLATSNHNRDNIMFDIYISGYSNYTVEDLFKIRYNDKEAYYPISDRIPLNNYLKYFDISTLLNQNNNSDDAIHFLNSFYRGDCYICQYTHRINRNFQDSNAPTNDMIVDENCWADHFKYTDGVIDSEEYAKINIGDLNAIQLGMWVTTTYRSSMNLCIRGLDDSNVEESTMFGHSRTFFPYTVMSPLGTYKNPESFVYNDGYSISTSLKYNFLKPDVPAIKQEYSNRIIYSNIQVNDAFQNNYRVFELMSYRDYPKTYGSIIKIVELRGNLLCVFEHGVGLIAVNERTVAGDGAGGNVYINTSNVLPENPIILSDMYGSLWRESVIKTPLGVYGVDTVAKKIWRTNGSDFEILSDFYVQEFLNQNISLTERELEPIIGIRNVKTHYNKFKKDVMFTFYDNLHGFNEKVWNLCYNETLGMWVTFYSWVPSYSENIYNQYFSFDRNTSKYIAKLGISKKDSDFADGVTLENNIIDQTVGNTWQTTLNLSNRNLPSGDNIIYDITYELVRDNQGNYKKFEIVKNEDGTSILRYTGKDITELCSELYQRKYSTDDEDITLDNLEDANQFNIWKNIVTNPEISILLNIKKDDKGRRLNLDSPYNMDKIVTYLNIRAHVSAGYKTENPTSLEEAYISGFTNMTFVDQGYYESTVALIPKYNMQFLTTDFWKHGQAGAIDIADKIYPTYWYGKQHPFEFEFIVADTPQVHKIFDSLEIVSNNVEPESFHYEIVGDCYDFAEDKKNMYIRQEATKELYQYNGCDITYAEDYIQLKAEHRPLINSEGQEIEGYYSKSTLLPLYYSRQDSVNNIEDFYHLKDNVDTKDFSALSGAEIVHYDTLDEYRIWNHAKAVDMKSKGRLRGNMQYQEDKWKVQINPINVTQSNEPAWDSEDLMNRTTEELSADKIPIELSQAPIPDEVLAKDEITPDDIPENSKDRAIVAWSHTKSTEVKPKDKWIKIRIRYTGDKLSVISLIRTLYSVSYA